jgi:hypothetical protein
MPAWAWVLIALAGCGVCGVPVLAAILFPVFAQAHRAAIRTQVHVYHREIDIIGKRIVADEKKAADGLSDPAALKKTAAGKAAFPEMDAAVKDIDQAYAEFKALRVPKQCQEANKLVDTVLTGIVHYVKDIQKGVNDSNPKEIEEANKRLPSMKEKAAEAQKALDDADAAVDRRPGT